MTPAEFTCSKGTPEESHSCRSTFGWSHQLMSLHPTQITDQFRGGQTSSREIFWHMERRTIVRVAEHSSVVAEFVAGELRKTEEGQIRLRPREWLIHLWCVQLRRDHSRCLSRPLFTESVSSTPVADAPDQVMRGLASGSSNTEVKRSSAPCSHHESET